jgi:hypothetical protein
MTLMRALAPLVFVAAASACYSSSTVSDDAGTSFPIDAASGAPVGQPCNPNAAVPCVATVDPCIGVTCDPTTRLCTQYITDAGGACSSGSTPCSTSADCDTGLTCGFALAAGCTATGLCINLAVQCADDAAACATGGTACGCGGQPVAVLIAGYASGPTSTVGANEATCPADAGAPSPGGDSGAPGDASGGG